MKDDSVQVGTGALRHSHIGQQAFCCVEKK